MRNLLLNAVGALAIVCSATAANAAITVNGGSVVNLSVPTPTVGPSGLTINFGQQPIGALQMGSFSFNTDAPTYLANILVGTSTTGETITSASLLGPGLAISPTFTAFTIGGVSGLGTSNVFLMANSTYTFSFTGAGNNDAAVGGNISLELAPVPEPATWGMMLVGFAGIGMAMRRRRQPALAQLA
jgi:PEP-CTERM motif